MNKKTLIASALCALTLCTSVAAVGCGAGADDKTSGGTVTVSGSTSVKEVMDTLAAEYQKKYNVNVIVNGGGSSKGHSDTQDGLNDFGMASSNVSSSYTATIEGKLLCTDGIVLAVGKNCGVTKVTNSQIYNLYMNGTAIEEGGSSLLSPIGRDAASGTREAFDGFIKGADGMSIKDAKATYPTGVPQQNDTSLVIEAIKNNPTKTVGYISMGSYLKNTDTLKALEFQAHGDTNYVAATVDNVKNGTYKLQRPFMLLTKKGATMSAPAKAFYDWLFTSEAQAIITAEGYILK